ncbi:hypothetical protein GGP56_003405 [Salinibacter ruber]|nr:hypothetical protein [Salinibacter ruber]
MSVRQERFRLSVIFLTGVVHPESDLRMGQILGVDRVLWSLRRIGGESGEALFEQQPGARREASSVMSHRGRRW